MNRTVYDVILADTKGRWNAVKNALCALDSYEDIPGVTPAQVVAAMRGYLTTLASELEKDYIHDETMAKMHRNI
jgi:hypothetical protein